MSHLFKHFTAEKPYLQKLLLLWIQKQLQVEYMWQHNLVDEPYKLPFNVLLWYCESTFEDKVL